MLVHLYAVPALFQNLCAVATVLSVIRMSYPKPNLLLWHVATTAFVTCHLASP